MKIALQIVMIIGFGLEAKSQNMLTIREVYDFEIGDEFQLKNEAPIPPNGKRIRIINKNSSLSNDTVFYTRILDSYYTTVNMSATPPQLDYFFSSDTLSYYITNLDSLIDNQITKGPIDSCNSFDDTIYFSTKYCGRLAYEYERCENCCFEGRYYNEIFVKGLGQVQYVETSPAWPQTDIQHRMFYYRKGNTECGTPDAVYTSVNKFEEESMNISIFPNPSNSKIKINVDDDYKLTIMNLNGTVLHQLNHGQKESEVDIGFLSNGIYFLNIETADGIFNSKLVKN